MKTLENHSFERLTTMTEKELIDSVIRRHTTGLSQRELIEDIQAEIGEASSESVDLTANLTDAESCETMGDLKANLLEARQAAQTIIQHINDQLARLS